MFRDPVIHTYPYHQSSFISFLHPRYSDLGRAVLPPLMAENGLAHCVCNLKNAHCSRVQLLSGQSTTSTPPCCNFFQHFPSLLGHPHPTRKKFLGPPDPPPQTESPLSQPLFLNTPDRQTDRQNPSLYLQFCTKTCVTVLANGNH